jgi:hypothetical protein
LLLPPPWILASVLGIIAHNPGAPNSNSTKQPVPADPAAVSQAQAAVR